MTDENLPYERFVSFGPGALSNKDLLAIILRFGTKKKNVFEVCDELLTLEPITSKGLYGFLELTKEDIVSVTGIGEVKAAQILCIIELSKRIHESKALEKTSFTSAKLVSDYYMDRLRSLDREHVITVFLDTKMRKIKDEIISVGTIDSSLVSTREIFKRALVRNAAFLIVLHNHPSGDSSPSKEDIKITKKLKEAGDLINIPLIDHIIIGDNRYYSFKEHLIL